MLRGRVHPDYFAILDLRLVVAEGHHIWRKLLVHVLGPNSPWVPQGATPKLGHPTHLKFIFSSRGIFGGLSESPWSPENHNIIFFQIGQKMTKLWTKTWLVTWPLRAIFAICKAVDWANYNICSCNLLYMISIFKIHFLTRFQLESL